MSYVSQLTVPLLVEGEFQQVTYDIKDAGARELIEALGNAMKWVGVTSTPLEDGSTRPDITIGGESHTAEIGDVTQFDGEEFAWNGSAWQSLGKNNFGSLAFKDSASGSYTPSGNVSITKGADTTDTIKGMASMGTLPSCSISGETLVFDKGTLPTMTAEKTFVTASGTDTATFSGTAATITVS